MRIFNYIIYNKQQKLKLKPIIKIIIFILFDFFFSSFKKKIQCEVCESNNFINLKNNLHRIIDKVLYIENNKNLLLSCSNCGTTTQSMKSNNFFNYFFLNFFYGISMPSLNDKILLNKAKMRARIVNKLTSENSINLKKILEISSHDGSTLIEIKKNFKNLDCYGIEPVKNIAIGSAERFKVLDKKIKCCLVEQYNFSKDNNKYDVILLSHAFRMINNPNEIIKKLQTVLSDNSLVIVDEGGLFDTTEYNKEELHRMLLLQKVNYFSFDSLSYIFEKNGFKELLREDKIVLEEGSHYNSLIAFKFTPLEKKKN